MEGDVIPGFSGVCLPGVVVKRVVQTILEMKAARMIDSPNLTKQGRLVSCCCLPVRPESTRLLPSVHCPSVGAVGSPEKPCPGGRAGPLAALLAGIAVSGLRALESCPH